MASLTSKEADPSKIAELMVGGRFDATYISRLGELHGQVRVGSSHLKESEDEIMLEVNNVTALDDRGSIALNNFSVDVKKGEILGLAGVAGNGQKELVEVLAGLRRPISGRITLHKKDITKLGVRERLELGLGVIFEDRVQVGIIGSLSIKDNLVIDKIHKPPFSKSHLINKKAIRDFAEKMVKEFSIDTHDLDAPAFSLSGGNMQKLILARVLSSFENLKVLIASEPTAGLDIAATFYIRSKLLELKKLGIGILLVSTNLDELLTLSDRIAVIYKGRVQGIVKAEEADRRYLGMLMGGFSLKAK
ncbi:MAG: ATP-binding cassette domain-containing protein [Desulfurococcaceae archaeon]